MFTRTQFKQLTSFDEIIHLHPKDFEWFCKFLLEAIGFTSVGVTRFKGDKGIDLYAKYNQTRVIGQCKRVTKGYHGYTPVKELRALAGCMHRDGYSNGVFISTLPFDTTDKKEAKQMNITLIGPQEICAIMEVVNPVFSSSTALARHSHLLPHLTSLFLF